jgi:hypothetical protein
LISQLQAGKNRLALQSRKNSMGHKLGRTSRMHCVGLRRFSFVIHREEILFP